MTKQMKVSALHRMVAGKSSSTQNYGKLGRDHPWLHFTAGNRGSEKGEPPT